MFRFKTCHQYVILNIIRIILESFYNMSNEPTPVCYTCNKTLTIEHNYYSHQLPQIHQSP